MSGGRTAGGDEGDAGAGDEHDNSADDVQDVGHFVDAPGSCDKLGAGWLNK